jgi:hypothetical protein
MVVERTITGVNDGSNPFDDQSSGASTNSNASNSRINAHLEDEYLKKRIIVNQSNFAITLGGAIDSSKDYFLDGIINIGTNTIEVPSTGLTITGYSFDLSGIVTNENNAVIFSSPTGGSGNLLLENLLLEASGTNGKVYDLTDWNGFSAIELNRVNFINCTSLGVWNNYRQGLEVGTGRFGGTPTLELAGTMIGGMRVSTSITRSLDAGMTGSLFKAGTGLNVKGRFITDMNCDLPAGASLLDFSSSNIFNNESLILKGAYFARSGVLNPQDTTITPNINASNVKCLWSDNTGIANTHKYIKSLISAQVLTPISTVLTYVDLNGTWTEQNASHISQIANNRWKILSGNGSYQITGDVTIEGNPGTQVSVKVSKSIDSGATWSDINHVKRPINSLAGVRDVGFFTINFISNLAENDLIKLEIENYTDTTDLTAEVDSFLIISQI